MYCPRCRFEVMGRVVYRSIEVYRCPDCGGVYLEPDDLPVLLGSEPSLSPYTGQPDRPPRHCFRCFIDMLPVKAPDGRILDRCEICQAAFVEGGQA